LSSEEVEWITGAIRRAIHASKAWASAEEAVGVLDVRLKREVRSTRLDALHGLTSEAEACVILESA
jgi:hypothetical protein